MPANPQSTPEMGLRQVALRSLTSPPLASAWRLALRDAIPVFMLHRFEHPDLGVRGHSVKTLRANLAWLRRRRIDVLPLAEVASDRSTPRPAVAFTVDDGYQDFADVALPVFREFDCPTTVFVPTDVVDSRGWYWWDRIMWALLETRRTNATWTVGASGEPLELHAVAERERAARRIVEQLKRVETGERLAAVERFIGSLDVSLPDHPPPRFASMSWETIAAATADGLTTVGPHTLTHPSLPYTDDAQAKAEIAGSWTRLRGRSAAAVPVFCYPFGLASERDERIVAEAGMACAVTDVPRYSLPWPVARSEPTRFRIPRFGYPDDRLLFLQVASGFERVKMALRGGAAGWRAGP